MTHVPGTATHAQYRATLHVPKLYNTGAAVQQGILNDIRDMLISMFGAFTRTEADGVWRDDATGIVYEDPQYLYHIDVNRENDVHPLRSVALDIRATLMQESVYVTVQPITAYLV